MKAGMEPRTELLPPDAVGTPAPPHAADSPLRTRLIGRRALQIVAALAFASACCVFMIAVRRHYSGHWSHLLLVWNLLLAWIPLPLAYAAYHLHISRARRGLLLVACALAWFVFFPNAPYITTDFVHLKQESQLMMWLDIIGIASFAWVGLCVGSCSLYLMHEIVRHRLGGVAGWVFVLGLFAATSVGTFLGRFQRWNSWDVLHRPFQLFADLFDFSKYLDPVGRVYLMMMFLFLVLTYSVLYAMMHLHAAGDERPAASREG